MAREQSGMLGSTQEVYYFQGSSTAHPNVCITTYTCVPVGGPNSLTGTSSFREVKISRGDGENELVSLYD